MAAIMDLDIDRLVHDISNLQRIATTEELKQTVKELEIKLADKIKANINRKPNP